MRDERAERSYELTSSPTASKLEYHTGRFFMRPRQQVDQVDQVDQVESFITSFLPTGAISFSWNNVADALVRSPSTTFPSSPSCSDLKKRADSRGAFSPVCSLTACCGLLLACCWPAAGLLDWVLGASCWLQDRILLAKSATVQA